MNELAEKKFLYLKGNDKADVLFHIDSSSFYRIYDPEIMRGFRGIFDGNIEQGAEVTKLEEINAGMPSCIKDCMQCKGKTSVEPEQFIIHKLALVLTSRCNLRCKYCYANYGMYDYEEETDIAEDVLIEGLSYLMNNFKDISNIQFFGGEPSLCWQQIKKTVEFFEEQVATGRKEKMPGFGIVTNQSK